MSATICRQALLFAPPPVSTISRDSHAELRQFVEAEAQAVGRAFDGGAEQVSLAEIVRIQAEQASLSRWAGRASVRR